MKNKILVLFVIVLATQLLSGCKNYDEPALINDPNQSYSQSPVVTSVSPANVATAGVREITINGQNFAVNGKDTNWVYIGGKPVSIKSITSNKIVVYRPTTSGTGLTVEVIIPKALSIGKISNYSLEIPVAQFGDFQYENYALMAIDVDAQENLYIASRRKILKLAADGINLTTLTTLPSAYASISDMKFGSAGKYLYVLVDNSTIYRVNATSGAQEAYVDLPASVDYMDFDSNQNIYAAAQEGLFVVTPQLAITTTGKYNGLASVGVRVVSGYVYLSTATQIWKNKIQDSKGSLGANELFLDITKNASYNKCEISSVSFAADGTPLLCLKNDPKYSLFVLEKDGSIAPYYNENILPKSIDQTIWGSGRYMYLNRGLSLGRDSLRVFRMGMDQKGAPHYGRQ
jgi:hypothetical protein